SPRCDLRSSRGRTRLGGSDSLSRTGGQSGQSGSKRALYAGDGIQTPGPNGRGAADTCEDPRSRCERAPPARRSYVQSEIMGQRRRRLLESLAEGGGVLSRLLQSDADKAVPGATRRRPRDVRQARAARPVGGRKSFLESAARATWPLWR